MANPLTDGQLKQIRAKVARRMNWDSMPDIWRWRWAIFLSEEPLERKFFAILMSCYPNFGKGISPEIEELAAIGGRQPRTVINHTTELHTKGYVPRESGGGRGITSSYELAIPYKLQKELAAMLGIEIEPEEAIKVNTVHPIAPYRTKTVQPVSPFEAETVQPNAPFLAKRCNITAETVQPVSPPILYTSSNNKIDGVANGVAHHANALPRPKRAQKSPPAGFENFIAKYRAEMRAHPGPGNAADRADTLPEVKAQRLWVKLEPPERVAAEEAISAYGRKQNSYMWNPDKYLENRPWRAMAAAAPKKQEAMHNVELGILMNFARTGDWPEEAREHWIAPPGKNGSRVPIELWREAQSAVRSLNGTGAHHAQP